MSDYQGSSSNFTLDLETTCEFFVGNLNKQKTRDEIFQDLTNIKIECLNENLYISKFNMPKFNARKDANGHLLLNLGYAFVTAKKPEMAAEMIERKRVKLTDGSDIEIKAVCRAKRLTANANCKTRNAVKFNQTVGDYKNAERFSQTVGDGRNIKSRKFTSNSQNDFRYSPRAQNNYNQLGRNDQYYNYNSRPTSTLDYFPEDFSNNQTWTNPPSKNSVFDNNNNTFGNLYRAPASLNVNQNNGQIWNSFEEHSAKQTTPVFKTTESQQSIFDVVIASSDDDRSSENLVCETLYNSSPNSDKIATFEMNYQSRDRLWSNQSRS